MFDEDDDDDDSSKQRVELREDSISLDQVREFPNVSDMSLMLRPQARRITLQSAWRSAHS